MAPFNTQILIQAQLLFHSILQINLWPRQSRRQQAMVKRAADVDGQERHHNFMEFQTCVIPKEELLNKLDLRIVYTLAGLCFLVAGQCWK